jgi:hypothetical protein
MTTALKVIDTVEFPSKCDECMEELETEAGTSCSATMESSGGSLVDDSASGAADELEEEIQKTLSELEDEEDSKAKGDQGKGDQLDNRPKARRPAGCPVDPCRIMVSVAYRKITTRRTLTLPPIPEGEPTWVAAPHRSWWQKLLCCLGSLEGFEDATPAFEPLGGMRRNKTAVDLAALGAAAA